MSNVIMRFSVYSTEEGTLNRLNDYLPTPKVITVKGEEISLSNGASIKRFYKETSYMYVYSYDDVVDIESCNNSFLSEWQGRLDKLKALSDHGYSIELNYEITVFNLAYPSLYFQPDFLAYLGDSGIVFSLYFYND